MTTERTETVIGEKDLSDIKIITDLAPTDWDGIAQLYYDEEWFIFHKDLFELNKILDWSKAVVAMHNGRVIGVLTWSAAPTSSIHYVSSYLLASGYRGLGIGRRLWTEMMRQVEPGRILGIDADDDMVNKYRAQDFPYCSPYGAYRIRFSATAARIALEKAIGSNTEETVKISPISGKEQIDQVVEYDWGISGRDRGSFLREYFKLPRVDARVALNDQGRVVGYSSRVPFNDAENLSRLGPLLADSFPIAQLLLLSLCTDFTGQLFAIRPKNDECPFLRFLLSEADCEVKSAANRSFSRRCPDEDAVDRSRVFAFTAHACQYD